MPGKDKCNNKNLSLVFWQLEGIEICFLTTVAWHGIFVFTVKPERIRTHCTNS